MNERLVPLVFNLEAKQQADGIIGAYVPTGFTLLGISAFGAHTSTPSAITVDIQDDGTDIVTAQDIHANGYTAQTTPIHIDADSLIEIDLNFTGGTTPAYTGAVTLWGLIG